MKNIYQLALVGLLITSCQKNSLKTEAPSAENSSLKVSMAQLKFEMDQALPLLVSPKDFHNPNNQSQVENRLRSLHQIGTKVSHEAALKDHDPILEFLSVGFQDEIDRSFEAYLQGHREFARVSLLNVSAYCIECHTRTQSGPSFETSTIDKNWSKMRKIDQVDYLVATRQFERARLTINDIAKRGLTSDINVFDLDRAVRLGLMVTVRYQQSPEHTATLVQNLLQTSQLPFYLKSAALAWKAQIDAWKKEPSSTDTLALSRQILATAQASHSEERFLEVQMFRIQALLNPLINTEKNSNRLSEALFLLGQSYEITKDLALWTLHESYYEACIQKAPGSSWARRCYDAYERSIYLGYTGTRGTQLPGDVQTKLKSLKKMAYSSKK